MINPGIAIKDPGLQAYLTVVSPPIATQRLSVDGQGRVVYQYKQPFRDGSTHVVLEPLAPMNPDQVRGRLWAQLLRRVFAIDIETCLDCGGTLRVIA